MKISEALEKIAIGKRLSSAIENKFRKHCESQESCVECKYKSHLRANCKDVWLDDNIDADLH